MNLKKLRFDTLETFLTLCETGSFSRTAELLNKSQGAISQQIALLETEVFNAKLVNRSSRDFGLTMAGVLLRGFAESTMKLLKQTTHQIESLQDEKTGLIKISASTTPGEYILPPLIAQFKEKYSKVDFDTVFNNSEKSLKLLLSDKVDFALVGSLKFQDIPPEILTLEIYNDQLVFIADKQHPLTKKREIHFKDLSDYPFILREKGSGTRREFETLINGHEIEPKLELENNHAIIHAITNTENVSVVSELFAKEAERAGAIIILHVKNLEFLPRPLYILKNKEESSSRVQDLFWEFIEEKKKTR